MRIIDYYRRIREDIANEEFDKLGSYTTDKPEFFNWAKDVFEPLNVEETPNDLALIWTNGKIEKKFTFLEISQRSNQFLNFLRKNGIVKGDKIYTQLPLEIANWDVYLTAIKGGFIVVPAATTLAVRDICYRFETLFPEVAVANHKNAIKIDEAEFESGKKIKLKIVTDTPREGWIHMDDVNFEEFTAETEVTRPDDHLFYFFTSGTTGMPKVVIHTHFTYPFGHLSTAAWLGLRHGDVHYNISQPGWGKFSWSSFFAPWICGATIFAYNTERFAAKDQLQKIEKYKVTTFCSPPTVLRMLILEDLKSFDLKFRQCVSAGEPLNPEIIEKWKAGTGIEIRDGYGQTESTCMVYNLPNDKIKYGSMGKPSFLYDIVIADDEGNILHGHEEGNICVQMDENSLNGIFVSYKDDEERTSRFFKDGLYYTGDKAYKDEDGYIWFVGRDDDVIKASDYRVGPFEVESILIEHDSVIEAAVVASPHDLRGYAIKAFVVLNKNFKPCPDLAEDIFRFSEKYLARYKIPRILEFVDTLPKTISGKIRRIELREQEALNKYKKVKAEKEFFHVKY